MLLIKFLCGLILILEVFSEIRRVLKYWFFGWFKLFGGLEINILVVFVE